MKVGLALCFRALYMASGLSSTQLVVKVELSGGQWSCAFGRFQGGKELISGDLSWRREGQWADGDRVLEADRMVLPVGKPIIIYFFSERGINF